MFISIMRLDIVSCHQLGADSTMPYLSSDLKKKNLSVQNL